MYKNRKAKKNVKITTNEKNEKRKALNTIDENATIKIPRTEVSTSQESSRERPTDILEDVFDIEENIPASQEPTQRYLSQRSTIAATLGRTQSRNLTSRPPSTYFELVFMKAGVDLDASDNFIISCDHVTFVNKFRDIIVKAQNYPENIETFKSGLRDNLNEKSKYAQKLLSGCTITIEEEESVYQSQDSMVVNFLLIDFLRDHVLEVLLDKIETAASSVTTIMTAGNIPYLPLLLAQLRCVTHSHSDVIYSRIQSIFGKASESARMDIIANAELILDSKIHDQFVLLLLDNTPQSKDLFTISTVQTLTNLYLSEQMQSKLRCKILAFIKEDRCPSETLPVLVKFLLKILNENNDEIVRELIKSIRDILIFHNLSTDSSNNQLQLELFQYIKQGLTRSKKFYTNWQKVIAGLSANQFKPIDFLIILLLIHVKDDNFLFIENILRRRIKLEHINVNILIETITKYQPVVEEYTNILLQMLHDFLKEKHKLVANFARASYSVLFRLCNSIQKSVIKQLLDLTCNKSVQNLTNLALELLRELQHKYPTDLQNWGMLLIPLLDRLNEMSLSQTRVVMELLCSIAFPAPGLSECSTLQDQIDMLVKKQLINRNAVVKKQGIIGSVQLIDSIARIEKSSIEVSDENTTFESLSDLPEGRGKMAANYVVRVQSATMYCPESMSLFYDELASVCAAEPNDRANCGYFDKPFLLWLCELVTFTFQSNFITEVQLEMISNINLSNQKCINSIEDTSTEDRASETLSIAINIGQLVLKPTSGASSSILVLAPLFNLMRVLYLQTNEGSLEQINALLGCAITLPTFFDDPDVSVVFYDYEEQLQRKILDIYFHCINWLREVISSFSTQCEKSIRRKVLQRLSELIKVEEKVRELLHYAPMDYVAPMVQFITHSASKSEGRIKPASDGHQTKKQKQTIRSKATDKHMESGTEGVSFSETNANISHLNEKTIKFGGKTKSTENKKNFEQLYGPRETYRQMGSEIMLILREDLQLQFPMLMENIGEGIGLPELRFIMTDLVWKIESIVGVQKCHSEQQLQHVAKPDFFINDMSKFLTKIIANMDMIVTALDGKLEQVTNLHSHADMFTDESNYLKVCFGLSIRFLSAYFQWAQFEDESKKDLLKESFLAILKPKKPKRAQSISLLSSEVFKKCVNYQSRVLELKSSVHLLQLLKTLRHFSNSDGEGEMIETQSMEIREICKCFLLRKWYQYNGSVEKGSACNICLDELVKGFLSDSDFQYQSEITQTVLEEAKHLTNKDSSLKTFPNIKKTNFPLLFRGLCDTLVTTLNNIAGISTDTLSDKLEIWEDSCELLNKLLEIVKAVDVPRNFQFFLKYSHSYLKLVLQHGLIVFEQYLRQTPERVNKLLKELQTTTRFLHNLCCHSKALKNTAIVSQIPFLRETVENFVFRVKALLAANKCAAVFGMNNLLNKNLQGDEILSQTTTLRSSAANEDSEEEIPEDDLSVDETTIGEDVGISGDQNCVTATRSKSSSRSKCF